VEIGRCLRNQTSDYLVDLLSPGNEELGRILDEFHNTYSEGRYPFPIYCIYETKKADYRKAMLRVKDAVNQAMHGSSNPGTGSCDVEELGRLSRTLDVVLESDLTMLVVDYESATLRGCEEVSLDVKHGDLIKFSSPEDPSFLRIVACLKRFQDVAFGDSKPVQ